VATSELLTAAQERALAQRIERGDQRARARMIEANLRLVHSLAGKYRGRGVAYDDLVQEGTLGLMRAVEGFDHRRELRFSTYAYWWIRRALLDAVGTGRTIRIPRVAARQLGMIMRAEEELPSSATDEAIARRAGLDVGTVRRLRNAPRVATSLDNAVGDRIADPDDEEGLRHVHECERRDHVRSILRYLPARQREVLVRRYGLFDRIPEAHREIGAALGVGEERSRQLEREALGRLRDLDAVAGSAG
jgi:RNA polymerase primary sigma factor